MPVFLVSIIYHEPTSWMLWNRGIIEDYESSTGIFVEADSATGAISWAEQIGQALLQKVNDDDQLVFAELGYYCWIEENPATSNWSHCLDFFQRVRDGEWPNLEAMGTKAYENWAATNGIAYR